MCCDRPGTESELRHASPQVSRVYPPPRAPGLREAFLDLRKRLHSRGQRRRGYPRCLCRVNPEFWQFLYANGRLRPTRVAENVPHRIAAQALTTASQGCGENRCGTLLRVGGAAVSQGRCAAGKDDEG